MISERDDVRLLKSPAEIWAEAMKILQKQLPLPTFATWIKPAVMTEISNGIATVGVVNDFMRSMVASHSKVLSEALSTVCGEPITVRVVFDENIKPEGYTPTLSSITVAPQAAVSARPQEENVGRPMDQRAVSATNLDPRHTFDTFVVGSNNRFSHSAALAVAKAPGHAYNPLFVYGGVGLGKTHLMHAIGHEILKHSPHLKVRYLSCEKFTNELVSSIREDRMADFRKRYRQVDVLLVDDIQFIQGKESTQEEFFHTFNDLRNNQRQIILSSDRPPSAIAKLEERLRSRFEWGLISDIQTPDLETRLAILQKKCQLENMRLGDDILEYIASLFTSNIRELEGALIRANAYASMSGRPLTIAALAEFMQPGRPAAVAKPAVTIEQLIEAVASQYRVEPSEIRSAKRSQDLTLPRHVAMYLAHELLQMSFPRIGQAFGNRKHTSAMHARDKVKELLPTDLELNESIRQIRKKLDI